jgi:hypothetical protein
MATFPFSPTENTIVLDLTATASTPVLLGDYNDGHGTMRIYNTGTAPVYLAFAPTNALASAQCVIPAAGSSQRVLGFPPGTLEVLRIPYETTWVVGITSSAAVRAELTVGR